MSDSPHSQQSMTMEERRTSSADVTMSVETAERRVQERPKQANQQAARPLAAKPPSWEEIPQQDQSQQQPQQQQQQHLVPQQSRPQQPTPPQQAHPPFAHALREYQRQLHGAEQQHHQQPPPANYEQQPPPNRQPLPQRYQQPPPQAPMYQAQRQPMHRTLMVHGQQPPPRVVTQMLPHMQPAYPHTPHSHMPQQQPAGPPFAFQLRTLHPPPSPVMAMQQISTPNTAPATLGPYPSPGEYHIQANPRAEDDCAQMIFAIQQGLPESVHRAVQANWQKCLLGSTFHEAFVINALVRRAHPSTVVKAFCDVVWDMLDVGKEELFEHLTMSDIDQLAVKILSKASDRFLDAAVNMRLRTMDAKSLINALARAERLGYEPGDIVEEEPTNGQEVVIPRPPPAAAQAPTKSTASAQRPSSATPRPAPAPSEPAPPPDWRFQCLKCNRLFQYEEPSLYHMRKKICKRMPTKDATAFKCSCPYCGQGFSTTLGALYHKMNRVCGDVPEEVVAESPRPSKQTPTPQEPGPGLAATPIQVQSQTQASPSSADWTRLDGTNPYGHLSAQAQALLDQELHEIGAMYGERIREAENIVNPNERRARIDGLKNSLSTRLSGVRKKHGVRLRERRAKHKPDPPRASYSPSQLLSQRVAGTKREAERQDEHEAERQDEHEAERRDEQEAERQDEHEAERRDEQEAKRRDEQEAKRRDEHEAKRPRVDTAQKETPEPLPGAAAAQAAPLPFKTTYQVALSDSSSDGEDDIPARLPAAVRQTLDQ